MRFAFSELAPALLPLTLQFVNHETNEVLRTIYVDGPGAIQIPSNEELGGQPVGVRIYYANGIVSYKAPGIQEQREK